MCIISFYYMATIVRALWLALFLYWQGIIFLWWSGITNLGIQGIFNLCLTLMDINVTVTWQLSKGVSADQGHPSVSQAQLYNSLRWCFFFKSCRWPVAGLNWLQTHVYNEASLFGHNKKISDLGADVLSSLNTSRPQSEIKSCLISSTWSTLWGLSKLQCTVHGLR